MASGSPKALGLDTEWLKQVPNAGGVDQSEARAMNTALWPATLGYFMDTLLKPVFSDDAHLLHALVLQRASSADAAPIPAIRIGRQPYGILPDDGVQPDALDVRRARVPHFAVR